MKKDQDIISSKSFSESLSETQSNSSADYKSFANIINPKQFQKSYGNFYDREVQKIKNRK